MDQLSSLSEQDLSRAVTYRFLSRLFASELDEATFSSMKNGDSRQLIDDLACEPDLKEPVRWLTFNLDQRNDEANTIMDLRVAYARLFLGAGGKRVAPPYASYYHNDRKSLNHPCVAEILNFYRDYGLIPDPNYTEPADHFALLLGFVSDLVLKGAPIDTQRTFIANYLAPILGDFSSDCAEHDPDGLYAAAAGLLQSFVQRDLGTLH